MRRLNIAHCKRADCKLCGACRLRVTGVNARVAQPGDRGLGHLSHRHVDRHRQRCSGRGNVQVDDDTDRNRTDRHSSARLRQPQRRIVRVVPQAEERHAIGHACERRPVADARFSRGWQRHHAALRHHHARDDDRPRRRPHQCDLHRHDDVRRRDQGRDADLCRDKDLFSSCVFSVFVSSWSRQRRRPSRGAARRTPRASRA